VAERRGRELLWVVAAAVAAHLVALSVPWLQWDDPLYVTANRRVQAPGFAALFALWSPGAALEGRFIEYFPLRDSVYWLLWQLAGNDPLPFHAVNIGFHALSSVLVLALGRRLALERAAFMGALLFAVHPIHVESVAWVAGLKDPLVTALLLGATLTFLRYREAPQYGRYAEMLALFIAALWVKAIAIAFPLALIALERLRAEPTPWSTTLKRVAAPSVIAAIFTLQFVAIGHAWGVITPPHGGSWASHAVLMGWAFVRYVQQALAPLVLRLHYCFEPPSLPFDVRMLAIVALAVLTVLFFRWAWRRDRTLALLGAWFFIWLLPVANLVPFPSLMADRYLYAPSVGSCLLLAALLARGSPSGGERGDGTGRWIPLALCLVYATLTISRGLEWRHERALWAQLLEDPACERDGVVTAAVIYLQNANIAATPAEAFALRKKALEHPAFPRLSRDEQCGELRRGAKDAAALNDTESAERWNQRAAALCASN
jgi:protein O-mannosyl-transferase